MLVPGPSKRQGWLLKDAANTSYCSPVIAGTPSIAICYEASTFPGDSGAPVFLYDDTRQTVEQIAVHMAADSSTIARVFTANRSAYAAPVFLINQDDRQRFCATP